MAESKYVFFIGTEKGTPKESLRVLVKLAWHSRPALNRWGLPAFIAKVLKEIPEAIIVEPADHREGKFVDITLKGPKSEEVLKGDGGPNSGAAVKLGREVTQQIESIVQPIADAEVK